MPIKCLEKIGGGGGGEVGKGKARKRQIRLGVEEMEYIRRWKGGSEQ